MQIPAFLDANDTGKQAIGLGARQILSGWKWPQDGLILKPVSPTVKEEECKKQNKTKTKKPPYIVVCIW